MKISNSDFVEIEYRCVLADTKELVDSSNGKIIVPLGKGWIPKYVENIVLNTKVGSEIKTIVKAKDAYGERNPNLIRIVPLSILKKNKIIPKPGMILNIDGLLATVRSVSGGRVIVDFNHPYAGKDIEVYVRVHRIVTDLNEKIEGLLKLLLKEKFELNIDKEKKILSIKVNKDLSDKTKDFIEKTLKSYIDELKDYKVEILAGR